EERLAAVGTDVVDEHVDAPPLPQRRRDELGQGGGVGDVELHRQRLAAGLPHRLRRLRERLGAAAAEHDPAALGGEREGDGAADAAAAAADDGDLAAEPEVHYRLPAS